MRDITGKKFGKLTAISPTTNKYHGETLWMFKCDCGNVIEKRPNKVTSNSSCGCNKFGYLLERGLNRGVNDLETLFPDVAKEWDYAKNGDTKPSDRLPKSNLKAWWICPKGHSYEQVIQSKVKGRGCIYCAGQKAIPGETDLATKYPNIASEWDYDKNRDTPGETMPGSHHKKWWICPLGHSYDMAVADRTVNNNGCPFCSVPAKRVLKGFNDLTTTHPNIAREWDYEKNTDTPDSVLKGCNRSKWWLCSLGHSYSMAVNTRTSQNCGCPYCSNPPKKVLAGFNDLASKFPHLVEEWDYCKNTLKPTEVTYGSHKKVWWVGKVCGHEYQMIIKDHLTQGCPICSKELRTSFPEQAVFYYLKQYYPNAISGDKRILNGLELDIYVPEKQAAIEYDGAHWHKDKHRDEEKVRCCAEKGIKLFRIREEGCPEIATNENTIIYKCEYGDFDKLSRIVSEICKELISKNVEVDIEKDRLNIYSLFINSRKEKSLANIYPEIAKQWHPIKNGHITPDKVKAQSNKTFWWICEKKHEWPAKICDRRNNGCPYCSNHRVLAGYNDLATTNPEMLNEWDYNKNDIFPTELTYGSHKKIWWKCKKGHNWESTILSRKRGGCPYCSNRRVLEGYNDLATTNPELAAEWDIEKNVLKPTEVTKGSSENVWWICKKGHGWRAVIATRQKCGCPYCSGNRILKGLNDLVTMSPEIANEWDYDNNDIEPTEIGVDSRVRVNWKCKEGHKWASLVCARITNGKISKCPKCRKNLNKQK